MRKLANIIWHIPFLGFMNALFTFLLGSILVLTVIGAPIGLGLIELSKFLLTPFSSEMVDKKHLKKEQNELWKSYGKIVRIIYFPFGLVLAIITIFQIVLLFVSIIGIPVAVILSKSLDTYFNPVNKKSVPRAVAKELESRKAKQQVEKYLG
ncbi:MAG: YccF domain-containing protein [Kordia sp.]|uniref:YccF domain-containing protein n=1 Tax=Kordia sp. TaxID=1965332 RepID=UPI00385FEC38